MAPEDVPQYCPDYTVKEKDRDNGKASNLDRAGTCRVSPDVRKHTFTQLFGSGPKRPGKGGVVDMKFDFSEADRILPHLAYAWMG